jgi:hypothetical protein
MKSIKGFAPSCQPSSSDGEAGTGSLPRLYSNISNESSSIPHSEQKFSSRHQKTAATIKNNCDKLIDLVGIERVGFFTLTFPENVTDPKEAQRRFNSFNTGFLNRHPYFGEFMYVKERQKRGAWHYHLTIDCGGDIWTGVKWEKRRKRGSLKKVWMPVTSTIPPFLRALWVEIRKVAPLYHFGRCELLPIRKNAESVSKYLAKYLSKHHSNRKPEDKGVRLVNYSRGWVHDVANFQWLTENSAKWRRTVGAFARCHGFEDLYAISDQCGSKWAYRLSDYITSIDWEAKIQGVFYIPLLREKLFLYLGMDDDCALDPFAVLQRLGIDPDFSLAMVGQGDFLDERPF